MVDLKITRENDVIYLSGEVDVGNCKNFKEKLGAAIGEAENDVTLDFTALRYIDSAGLGILVGIYKQLSEKGKSLTVVNANDYIKKLFRITKLETLFTVV